MPNWGYSNEFFQGAMQPSNGYQQRFNFQLGQNQTEQPNQNNSNFVPQITYTSNNASQQNLN